MPRRAVVLVAASPPGLAVVRELRALLEAVRSDPSTAEHLRSVVLQKLGQTGRQCTLRRA